MKYKYITITALLQLSLTGCISDASHVEDDFGMSVTQMINAQIYDPAAASRPDLEPPLIIDGTVAGTSVDGYRKDAKREENANSNVSFTIN